MMVTFVFAPTCILSGELGTKIRRNVPKERCCRDVCKSFFMTGKNLENMYFSQRLIQHVVLKTTIFGFEIFLNGATSMTIRRYSLTKAFVEIIRFGNGSKNGCE